MVISKLTVVISQPPGFWLCTCVDIRLNTRSLEKKEGKVSRRTGGATRSTQLLTLGVTHPLNVHQQSGSDLSYPGVNDEKSPLAFEKETREVSSVFEIEAREILQKDLLRLEGVSRSQNEDEQSYLGSLTCSLWFN